MRQGKRIDERQGSSVSFGLNKGNYESSTINYRGVGRQLDEANFELSSVNHSVQCVPEIGNDLTTFGRCPVPAWLCQRKLV